MKIREEITGDQMEVHEDTTHIYIHTSNHFMATTHTYVYTQSLYGHHTHICKHTYVNPFMATTYTYTHIHTHNHFMATTHTYVYTHAVILRISTQH